METGVGIAPAKQPPDREPEARPRLLVDEEGPAQSLASVWLLWANRRFLFKVAIEAALLTAIAVLFVPNRYESTASFVPSETTGKSLLATMAGKALGSSSFDLDPSSLLGGGKSDGALFTEILKSRTVQDALINKFDLRKVYHTRYYEIARKDLAKKTLISEDKKSGIITLTVTDKDRNRAAAMARVYLEEMNSTATELNTSAAHRERVFIEGRLATVKNDLDTAARNFSQFSSKNSAIDITEQGKAMVESAAMLQGQMIAAQAELKSLQEIYTANNVRVRATESRIAELRHQLEVLGGSGTSTTEPDSETSIEDLYPPIRKLPLLGVQYADLYRRVKIQETIFQLLTQQYELAKIEEAKQLPSARVLDQPEVPERKSFPPRTLIVISSAILGFVFAGFYILGKRRWDDLSDINPNKLFVRQVGRDLKTTFRRIWRRTPGESNMPWSRAEEPVAIETEIKDHVSRR